MKALLQYLPRSRSEIQHRIRQLQASPAATSLFWVMVGSGGYQVIRLASNLVLTRLLFPEVFGLMAIVTAVMVGLGLVSDVGLREGVVNSNRINDPTFMRTAWTLQIARGGLITALAIGAAWPLAIFYNEPLLAPVLVVISLSTLVSGFKSIALLAYDKRLDIKTQMISDLSVQVTGVVVTIVWAWLSPSIWALVAGQLVSTVLELYLSYRLFRGHHSAFAWDRATVSKLIGFGKWILISSLISYIGLQGDRLIMGAFLTMAELGKYSVAATWAAIVSLLSVNISTRVMHPYYRQAIDAGDDYSRIRRFRTLINLAYTSVCVVLALIGDWLIIFLYDDRYADAGWMLQILALGQVGRAINGTLTPFILAQGDSFRLMKFSAVSSTLLVLFILLGGYLAGSPGVIFGLALAGIAAHPVMIAMVARYGFRCFFADMGLIGLAALTCIIGWWLTDASIIDVIMQLPAQANISSASN